MFTQLDDDGQKFMVAYANRSNNEMEARYTLQQKVSLYTKWFNSRSEFIYLANED
jgi:hypothetical protein